MNSRTNLVTTLFILPLLITAAFYPAGASTDPELRKLLKEAIESDAGFEDRFDAQVWLLDMSRRLENFVADPKTRIELLKQVHYEARRVGIEPELVLAIIEVESRFDKFAISVSGARGLMQIMPFWLNEIGISDKNLFKIRTNLRMGCTILRYYIDMEPDNLGRALARYNGSLGKNIYPNKVITALRKRWFKQ
ncbi:MAG: lytic transglycosylase domain-containing protein [Gammaproteobacteria bacterium]|nr:lytic transglycosylase domain-containing protein [Gammaproteobacteria bacterium]MDH3534465.1 lytic transglycosylase domain-containing protein [Gammaproteobacteria bacterium]